MKKKIEEYLKISKFILLFGNEIRKCSENYLIIPLYYLIEFNKNNFEVIMGNLDKLQYIVLVFDKIYMNLKNDKISIEKAKKIKCSINKKRIKELYKENFQITLRFEQTKAMNEMLEFDISDTEGNFKLSYDIQEKHLNDIIKISKENRIDIFNKMVDNIAGLYVFTYNLKMADFEEIIEIMDLFDDEIGWDQNIIDSITNMFEDINSILKRLESDEKEFEKYCQSPSIFINDKNNKDNDQKFIEIISKVYEKIKNCRKEENLIKTENKSNIETCEIINESKKELTNIEGDKKMEEINNLLNKTILI